MNEFSSMLTNFMRGCFSLGAAQAAHLKAQDARVRNARRQERTVAGAKHRQEAELERFALAQRLRADAGHKRAVDDLMAKVS
jgi:hypothetical protein